MKLILNNDKLIIQNPNNEVLTICKDYLHYTNKSKQFQLKRLGRTLWGRSQPAYKQLKEEVKGQLYKYENDELIMSSCFIYLFKGLPFEDNRKATGKTISLPWVKKPYDLRDYQQETFDLFDSNYRGIANLATGLGKTLTAIHFIRHYKKKTLIVCPSQSIAQQFYEQACSAFGKNKVGMFGSGKKQINDITVGIAASVVKHTDDFKKAELGLIIFDEGHHAPADQFFKVSQDLANTGKIFGLTATAYRSDGLDIMINAGVGDLLIQRDARWGIKNGHLSNPYFFMRKIQTQKKDLNDKLKNYKYHVLDNKNTKDIIYNDAKRFIDQGKKVLILVDMVEHGAELAKQLGIPLATGTDKNSQSYVDQLNEGKIPALVGVDSKIAEGTDLKAAEVLILANFVAAKGPTIQSVGRVLRKQGTKDKAIIIDYILDDCDQLRRHSYMRLDYYKELSDNIKII